MSEVFILLIGGFSAGMIIGMKVGPSTEEREALRLDGYLRALRKAARP